MERRRWFGILSLLFLSLSRTPWTKWNPFHHLSSRMTIYTIRRESFYQQWTFRVLFYHLKIRLSPMIIQKRAQEVGSITLIAFLEKPNFLLHWMKKIGFLKLALHHKLSVQAPYIKITFFYQSPNILL